VTKKPTKDEASKPSDSDVLLPDEVALRLGLTTETVIRALRDGVLPGQQFDEGWRVHWPAIIEHFGHDPARDVIRPAGLAHRLGLNEQTVRQQLSSGKLPGRKIGNQWFSYWPAVIATLGYGDPVEHGSDSSAHDEDKGG
jgi:hypothetical protein